MKKTIRSIKTLLASGLMLVGVAGNAQNYSFGQNVDFAFGYKPTIPAGTMLDAAETAYQSWKTNYLVAAPACSGTGTMRVKFDTKSGRFVSKGVPANGADITTVSEGIAYGMLLTAYHGDQIEFDALWKYYLKFVNKNGIMNWGINNTSCSIVGDNGATDAELDVAWALWVAHNQFGNGTASTYLTEAKRMIGLIKQHEVDAVDRKTLKPGDQFGGAGTGDNNLVNPSYFSPMYYRVFGEITNDVAFWSDVYDRGYDILELAANQTTGLVPDWCTVQGTSASGAKTNGYDFDGNNFFYDAIRTPFRTSLDYLWYGDEAPRAFSFNTKLNSWLKNKHPNVAQIGSCYKLDGTTVYDFNSGHNNTFVGIFAVSAMATSDINTKSYITALYNENVKVNPGSGEYFNSSWKALSLFTLSGNFYLPPPDLCAGPYLETEYNLCSSNANPKSITLDCGLSGASKYEWKEVGSTVVLGSSKTYSTQKAGLYEVSTTILVKGKPCVRRASTIVNAATPTASFIFTRNGTAVDFKNTSTGGDFLSGTLVADWTFGTGATPPTSTTQDGATNYSSGGSKLVTLKVTNACNVSSTFTETVPLLVGSGPGWVGTNFTNQNQAEFGAYTSLGVVNPNVVLDITNCQYAKATANPAMDKNETIALTFKSPTSTFVTKNNPLNVSAYPYARFRIKIESSASVTTLFPNGLRVDLNSWNDGGTPAITTDDKYPASGAVSAANVVYLKGPRNPDGTYQPIPLNQWFVSTISFENVLTTPGFDPTKVLQLSFTPYNDLPNGSANRKPFTIYVDWATVGNADITKPNPVIANGVQTVCVNNPFYDFMGDELDSCNAEKAVWSDGFVGFKRRVGIGSYTVEVSNFAGKASRAFTVTGIDTIQPNLTYSVVSTSPFQIQPIDKSIGDINIYRWHRVTSPTQVTSGTYVAPTSSTNSTLLANAKNNTMLYNSTTSTPSLSPLATTGTISQTGYMRIFTGNTTEYLCLVATAVQPGCTVTGANTAKKCIQVFPTGPLVVEESLSESTFAIFPTVVTDNRLNVQLGTGLQDAYEVQVMNVNGTQVATAKAISGNNEIVLDSNLPAGTYIVKVSQGDKIITKRFIKQ